MIPIKKAGGFTLIEVMVALTTLAIGLLAVMGLHLSSIRADTRNRDQSRALFLANQKVEELRSLDFELVQQKCNEWQYEPGDEYFDRLCLVSASQGRRDLEVTVRWPLGEPPEKQKKVRVATIIVKLD